MWDTHCAQRGWRSCVLVGYELFFLSISPSWRGGLHFGVAERANSGVQLVGEVPPDRAGGHRGSPGMFPPLMSVERVLGGCPEGCSGCYGTGVARSFRRSPLSWVLPRMCLLVYSFLTLFHFIVLVNFIVILQFKKELLAGIK